MTDHALNDIVLAMDAVHGIDLSIFEEDFLQRIVDGRCVANGIQTDTEYAEYLSNNNSEAEKLLDALNITYSEFFRNPLTFANLEQWLLPKLIEQKATGRELRVWSAGCASGQEPYSIAMLLEVFNATRSEKIRYRIFATDVSDSALETAQRGEYENGALKNITMKFVKMFFEEKVGKYKVIAKLKEHISFVKYDILDISSFYPHESIFGNFDIVFCSNLMIYYKRNQQQFIMDKLMRAMAKDGYLITGEAENALALNEMGLRMVAPPAAIFQRKGTGGTI